MDTMNTTTEPTGWTTRHQGIIVIVPNYWGWGVDLADAIRQVKRAAPRGTSVAKGKRAVYALPVGAVNAWVDDYGRIQWTWEDVVPDPHAVGTWLEQAD